MDFSVIDWIDKSVQDSNGKLILQDIGVWKFNIANEVLSALLSLEISKVFLIFGI